MKKQISKLLIISLLLAPLAACQQPGDPYGGGINKQSGGTLLGGLGGAALGSQFGKGNGRWVTGIAGGLLGAYLGNQVGASLDRADMQYYNQTSQAALESNRVGQASTWRNPDSGNYGTITPTNTYTAPTGQVCREYTQTINVGGQAQKAYGKACRQSDGSWQIAN